jgi:hypothetical protein
MDDKKTKKNIGRPAKYAGEGKRPTLTFRVRGTTHRQLQEAAIQNECSISEEIERRIQQSFELKELLGTERPSLPAQLVSRAIEEVEERHQTRWFETEQAAAACREAAIKVSDVVLGAPLENQLWPDEVKTA